MMLCNILCAVCDETPCFVISTGSAESIAVSSLIAYDIYREYFNPDATGKQILLVSRIVIVCFGIFMGLFSVR